VRLTASSGQIRLSAQSQELGEAEETLPAEFAGDELTIGFNARYVLEALGPMDHPWTVVGPQGRPQSGRVTRRRG
jgi:DNA polymerase-3 subunit beta